MKLSIRGRPVNGHRARAEQALRLAFCRFGDRVTGVSLEVDQPSPHHDVRCVLQVELVAGDPIILEDTGRDMVPLLDGLAERGNRAVSRALDRARTSSSFGSN